MVKVTVVAVGKIKEGYLRDAVAEYAKRLSRFCELTIKDLPERATLKEEGEEILRAAKGYRIALAVEGKQRSSEELASLLKKLCDEGKEITFVIGSSCGLDEGVKGASDELLSFSRMTFPHQLMRVILCEQVYRAFMINAGAVYHK